MLNRLSDLIRLRAYADLLVQPVGRVGERVVALVQYARGGGAVRATIHGQEFDLQLPFNARAGDSLALRVTAREPQLRFAFDAGPAADDAPRPATLSETARFITALLAESEKLPVSAAAVAGPPLLEHASTDSRVIANVLKSALADSGMFYESHQAQWVAEQRPLAALLREPQAALRPLRPEGADGTAAAEVPQLKELPVHRDALIVVRQQLETLETRHIAWQGTLWPGQSVEWEVGEDDAPASAPAAGGRTWQSRLRMTLPRLGGIDATLSVSALGVRINLRAGDADSAALFEAARPVLREALIDAGVLPLGIGVVHAGA
jgi:hypothetical protein